MKIVLGFNTYVALEDNKNMLDGNFIFFGLIRIQYYDFPGSGYSQSGRETPQGPDSIFIEVNRKSLSRTITISNKRW